MTRKKAVLIVLLLVVASSLFAISYQFNHYTITNVTLSTSDFKQSNQFSYTLAEPFMGYDSIVPLSEETSIPEKSLLIIQLKNRFGRTRTLKVFNVSPDGISVWDERSNTAYRLPHGDGLADSPLVFDNMPEFKLPSVYIDKTELFSDANSKWQFKSFESPDTWLDVAISSSQDVIHERPSFSTTGEAISLQLEKPFNTAVLKVKDATTGTSIYEDFWNSETLYMPSKDGVYLYELQMIYKDSNERYRGNLFTSFSVSVDRPTSVSLRTDEIFQGENSFLDIEFANPDETFTITGFPNESHIFDTGAGKTAMLAADYRTTAKTYPLEITSAESGETWSFKLKVKSRPFHIQQLVIDEGIATSTKNDAANEEFTKIFDPVRQTSFPQDLTEGDYILPTTGRLSTEYGETRYVNGSPTSYRHSGLDIAAPTGREVVATNTGNVVLAYPLTLTGNTIAIDHGQGIFSVYFHLNSMTVSTGDAVKKGDLIGTVGTTGFSTGPHLHFIISYYDKNLEPGYFLFGEPVTYNNYKNFLQ